MFQGISRTMAIREDMKKGDILRQVRRQVAVAEIVRCQLPPLDAEIEIRRGKAIGIRFHRKKTDKRANLGGRINRPDSHVGFNAVKTGF
jgi:hypothetical protein